jgi:dienelactone hydrolase
MARRPDAAERAGYQREPFEAGGIRHFVWRGGEGPAVLLLHEMPSISWRTIALANLIRDRGYRVAMPGFVDSVRARPDSPIDQVTMGLEFARNAVALCVSWQFTVLTQRRTAPIASWLQALARHEQATSGHPLIGVVGMCFSGGFALATAIDPSVGVAVASQPALPMAMAPFDRIRGQAADPGLSPTDLDRLVARGDELCVRAYRYSTDRIAPRARIDTLVDRLGPTISFIPINLAENGEVGPHAHSVLTDAATAEGEGTTPAHKARKALDDLLAVLDERLKATAVSVTE